MLDLENINDSKEEILEYMESNREKIEEIAKVLMSIFPCMGGGIGRNPLTVELFKDTAVCFSHGVQPIKVAAVAMYLMEKQNG